MPKRIMALIAAAALGATSLIALTATPAEAWFRESPYPCHPGNDHYMRSLIDVTDDDGGIAWQVEYSTGLITGCWPGGSVIPYGNVTIAIEYYREFFGVFRRCGVGYASTGAFPGFANGVSWAGGPGTDYTGFPCDQNVWTANGMVLIWTGDNLGHAYGPAVVTR